MNKETFIENLKRKKYDMYNYWERCENNLKNEIDMLISYYQKELAIENAELEAKVYTYENIIANSNFKSVLTKDKASMQKKIEELEQELEILKGDSNE